MKTVILCGGRGTRISEETDIKPKPMVTVGEHPILWHIMKSYERFGFTNFLLALGYKADVIKDYFFNFRARNSDFEIDLANGNLKFGNTNDCNWKVGLVDTGLESMTGGRVRRLRDHLKETFLLTYGDGVSDVHIPKLLEFHKKQGKLATVTAVRPSARFGGLGLEGDLVTQFAEKPTDGEGWINGGFFVFEPGIFEYLKDDATILERDPLENLAKDGQLAAFKHNGFWQCMDTVRDRQVLESYCQKGTPPWLTTAL